MAELAQPLCSRCQQPCDPRELACRTCLENERQSSPSLPDEPLSGLHAIAQHPFDDELAQVEAAVGEVAQQLRVDIDALLGAEGSLRLSVQTAVDGPFTPPEDIWTEPQLVAQCEGISADERAARIAWVKRISAERGLLAPRIEERYRLGGHDFAGDLDAIPLLLSARLRRAQLFLEGFSLADCGLEKESDAVLRCVARFTHPRGRVLHIELFGIDGAKAGYQDAITAWLRERGSQ